METHIIDTIVNNVLHRRRTIAKQISLMQNLFVDCFDKDITEEDIRGRMEVVRGFQKKLEGLLKLPKVEQRSEEWYAMRKQLITASDFGQALGKGKFGSVTDFYINKCGYKDVVFDATIPALQWGIRYEEVANMFYKTKMNVEVHEFGLLQHPTHSWIGASPDGISNMGVMLEIKCPWIRKCTHTIPDQYYYQIQGQLEVCGLNECDYLECYIKEFDDREEMLRDSTCRYKGSILRFVDGSYRYGRLNDTGPDAVDGTRRELKDAVPYYYGIHSYFMKRVYRDKPFFEGIVTSLSEVWKNVEAYRADEELYRSSVKKKTRAPPKPKAPLFREDADASAKI